MTPKEPSKPIAGRILVAKADLLDPNFRESLVFLAEHNPEGTFGLILNRPTGQQLGDVVGETLPKFLQPVPVMLGGPVEKSRIILATFQRIPGTNRFHCTLTLSMDEIEAQLADGTILRAFAGYAGWGEGQLASEIAHDSWLLSDPSPALFDDKLLPGLWLAYASGDERWRTLIPHLPDDPSLN